MYKIKNWEEFQPPLRPDRNVIWIKLYRKVLDDFNWSNLTDSNKATLIELWLLASEKEGNLPAVDEIAFRLRRDKSFINKQLEQLSSFVLRDDADTLPTRLPRVRVRVRVEKELEKEIEVDNGFDLFWKNYPKRIGKGKAQLAWKKHKPDIDEVLKTLFWQLESKEWFNENGKFIPHPTTWINAKRWLDEPTEVQTF
tara:strand:- start:3449 stop:4039 length:591 start_codon:yes stop_codon:yes gene_type:complete